MSRIIPTINTSALTLRGMRTEDFKRFSDIWAMRDVVTYIGAKPWPRARSWNAFLRNAGHWQIVGFGQWAIQVHGTADMAGQTGFLFGSRGLGDDFDPFPEARWILSPEYQGRGLGRNAAGAAHDWFDRVISGRTVCMINPENKRSVQIAEHLGYHTLREAKDGDETILLMSRKGPPV